LLAGKNNLELKNRIMKCLVECSNMQ